MVGGKPCLLAGEAVMLLVVFSKPLSVNSLPCRIGSSGLTIHPLSTEFPGRAMRSCCHSDRRRSNCILSNKAVVAKAQPGLYPECQGNSLVEMEMYPKRPARRTALGELRDRSHLAWSPARRRAISIGRRSCGVISDHSSSH